MIRTSIYVKMETWEKLIAAESRLNISRHEILWILVSRLTDDNRFDARYSHTVTYQESDPEALWKIKHVKFEPVFYEKCQDLRRHFKFSVSWFISFAIEEYLDKLIEKLSKPKNREKIQDNYNYNYVYIAHNFGPVKGFHTYLDFPDQKYLKVIFE